MKPTTPSKKDRFAPQGRWGKKSLEPRRTEHGGMAWINAIGLRQPQDGALETPFIVEEMPSPRVRGSFSKLNEPEDAGLTGSTRSLGRRLLGLNVAGSLAAAIREPIQPKRASIIAAQIQIA